MNIERYIYVCIQSDGLLSTLKCDKGVMLILGQQTVCGRLEHYTPLYAQLGATTAGMNTLHRCYSHHLIASTPFQFMIPLVHALTLPSFKMHVVQISSNISSADGIQMTPSLGLDSPVRVDLS